MRDYQPLKIVEVRRETPEAISVTLHIPEQLREAFRFKSGQHLPVRASIDGEEQRRTYSICCAPSEADLRIAIKRIAEGRFSNWANDTLAAGGTPTRCRRRGGSCCPRATGPRGMWWPRRRARRHHADPGHGRARARRRAGDQLLTLVTQPQPDSIMFRQELEDSEGPPHRALHAANVLPATRSRARRCSRAASRPRRSRRSPRRCSSRARWRMSFCAGRAR
jgi:hypothetical protein